MTAILGAGISGLAAGHYLRRKAASLPLTIYEASDRVGGWIRSERSPKDDFIFEAGPRTIRPKGPAAANTLELIENLGLADHVYSISSSHTAARNRMIYAKGKLNLLPSSLGGLFKTMPPFTKPLFLAAFRDLLASRSESPLQDESMYSFVNRRFGKEIADYAVSSMLCGICAGNAKEISVKFLMKELFEREQQHGGVIKGMLKEALVNRNKPKPTAATPLGKLAQRAKSENWSIYSLRGGLQTLPDTLAADLQSKSVSIVTGTKFEELKFDRDRILLRVDGKEQMLQHLVSSIPSYKLAKHVDQQHPVLAATLRSIPFVDVCVINMQYRRADLLKQDGFGFLVPPIENLPILGVIFDSCCFDMQDNTVLTVMMGGAWFEQWFGKNPSEDQLLEVALTNVQKTLGIDQRPDAYKVNLLRKCIPQYTVGHQQRVSAAREYITKHKLPIALCGASYDGVGVNDVILSARNNVETIFSS
ncbi:protoporphyrinogen oxidase-like [Anopheles albimanus]|uniref:protoporphyrinogen oxidase-like n=1 Tax=Anopheles albimanus TaxID=7167 RepID=UPI001642302A|nr:protoporphyrinogen oxidase-like [Anopheles albimanus]